MRVSVETPASTLPLNVVGDSNQIKLNQILFKFSNVHLKEKKISKELLSL